MSISKKKLLELIEHALTFEEEVVKTVSRNIISAINFLEEDQSKKNNIEREIKTLSNESSGHAKILKETREIILRSKKDVY